MLELNAPICYLAGLPNGDQLACSCTDEFHLFTKEHHLWTKKQTIALNGYGLINGLSLSPDATKLITTSINGLVDLFEIKWKKSLISRYFEINFMGSNQISVRSSKESHLPEINVLIRSKSEIKNVKIVKRRYAIVWTKNSLIFSDLEVASNSSSNAKQFTEIDWTGMTTASELRFCFDFDSVVLINVIGELYIFQLSNGQLLTSVRTDFISPHLMRYCFLFFCAFENQFNLMHQRLILKSKKKSSNLIFFLFLLLFASPQYSNKRTRQSEQKICLFTGCKNDRGHRFGQSKAVDFV